MGIGYYIICTIFIVFGLVGIVMRMINIGQEGEKEGRNKLLDEMWKNGDIDAETYVKYTKGKKINQ